MRKIAIFDFDVYRRGAMSRQIFDSGNHCEPYETLEEFADQLSTIDLVLAFDDGAFVTRILQALNAADLWVPVVIYGLSPSTRQVVDALHQGAVDYLDWPVPSEEVRGRLDRLLAGKKNSYAAMWEMAFRGRHAAQALTRRERQILQLLRNGQSNKEMGKSLGISPRTVEQHRANMMSKLGAANTVEAIGLAICAELSAALPEPAEEFSGLNEP